MLRRLRVLIMRVQVLILMAMEGQWGLTTSVITLILSRILLVSILYLMIRILLLVVTGLGRRVTTFLDKCHNIITFYSTICPTLSSSASSSTSTIALRLIIGGVKKVIVEAVWLLSAPYEDIVHVHRVV